MAELGDDGDSSEEELLEEQTCDQTGSLEEPENAGYDTDLDVDVTSGAAGSKNNVSQTELYLQTCRSLGTTPISAVLRAGSNTTLDLNHYGVGPLGARALVVALEKDTVITNLELEDNGLTTAGTYYLMKILQSNNTIESLNISHNQLGLEGATLVCMRLLHNFHVKIIKLAGNDLDDSAIELIADAMMYDYVVEELDLSGNRFSSRGEKLLGQMIARNEHMEILNLSWNLLRGATTLFAGLKVNATLKELLLSHNNLGPTEAKLLSLALKDNGTLQRLDLNGNSIDDEAAGLLSAGLTANGSLKVLTLVYNPLTSVGALHLLKAALGSRSALEMLDITSVFVCDDFVDRMRAARQQRPTLNVQYSVMTFIPRNLVALQVFRNSLKDREMSMREFFQTLDKDGSMRVSTLDFRKAVKEGKIPLDQHQVSWLVKKFDKSGSGFITYSQFV